MNEPDHPISLLLYGTFAAVLIIAIVLYVRYRMKNPAHPMAGERERNIEEIRDEAPPRD